ncbi:LamG-like jellyroll fold domain-containing protein [Lachnoclostridium sp.]|uniref:LamG-like jellyroll fold domain-containing protein n=1 Tax=Lachnoclostridium sp. TaxID=2028282 RepID=UPI002899AC0A|nr:LamG-like jellyroll fold domain-containing protein [Lachnoclostridium sp.]
MADSYVTIGDLQLLNSLDDSYKLLIDDSKNGDTKSALVSVLKEYLINDIKPNINKDTNTWFVGGVDTGISANGIDNIEIVSDTDTEYILKFTTKGEEIITPNLKASGGNAVSIDIKTDTESEYVLTINDSNKEIITPNLKPYIPSEIKKALIMPEFDDILLASALSSQGLIKHQKPIYIFDAKENYNITNGKIYNVYGEQIVYGNYIKELDAINNRYYVNLGQQQRAIVVPRLYQKYTNEFTIMSYTRLASATTTTIIFSSTQNGGISLNYYTSNNTFKLNFRLNGSYYPALSTITPPKDFDVYKWHLYTVSYTAKNNVRFYIDEKLVIEVTIPYVIEHAATTSIMIGGEPIENDVIDSTLKYDHIIHCSYFCFYNRQLSFEEIKIISDNKSFQTVLNTDYDYKEEIKVDNVKFCTQEEIMTMINASKGVTI